MSKNLVSLFLAMTGLAACGSGSKETTVAQFTLDVSQAECDSVAPACRITPTECVNARQAYWSQMASAAMAEGRPFDPSHADSCVSETKGLYEVLENYMAISAKDYRLQKQACERVFHGPVVENGQCTTNTDCIDALVCDKGFCGKAAEVPAGEQCANIGQYCSQGYTCASIGDSGRVWRCVVRATKGAVCTEDATCLEALRCAGGVCADGLLPNTPCQSDTECDTGFCEPFARVCAADIRFAGGSDSCKAFQSTAAVGPVSAPSSSRDGGLD